MVRELFRSLSEAVRIESFDHIDDPSMKRTAPLVEETAVRDLVRERMLEGVLEVREQTRLIEELGGLEVSKTPAELRLGKVGNPFEQCHRDVFADSGGRLQEDLLVRRKAIDASSQDAGHSRGDVDVVNGAGEAIGAWRANKRASLDEASHAFFEKEGVPFRSRDEHRFEWLHTRVIADETAQELIGRLDWQRVDAELGVIRLTAPPVLVFRPVVHKQEDVAARQALDDPVEQRLRLRVDPMQVLEHEDERLHLALAEQESLDGVKRAIAPRWRIEHLP